MDFSFLPKYYKFYLYGARTTLLLAVFTVFIGVVIGVFFALMKISKRRGLRFIAATYIEFIRGTPLMVQLFIIYYGLPQIGIRFPSFNFMGSDFADIMPCIITLSINSGAYVAEIIRAGIQAIDKGQMEAARSLGLTHAMAMQHVILPQAFKNILPALGNEFIVVIKESSIVSLIGIAELMYNTDTIRGNTFNAVAPLLVAALMYFVMTFTLSKFLGVAERRMRASD